MGLTLLSVCFFLVYCTFTGSTVYSKLCEDKSESWNYVNVRPHAHIFWWAYCTTAKAGYAEKPLILWLQGGPGGSSTGFGNFGELGPLDVHLKPRNTTWLSQANLLFIDNPVGAGFSYASADDGYTTDVWQIADDLLTTLKSYMKENANFQKIPFYIFSESYGGKMTAAFSKVLLKAIKEESIQCNFKGFAMGDSWISPMDSVLTWGPYLYATSVVDAEGLAKINKSAMQTQAAVDAGKYKEATNLWQQTEDIIAAVTHGVDFYNILKWDGGSKNKNSKKLSMLFNGTLANLYNRHVAFMQNDDLSELMNGPIRKKLGIIPKNVTWGGQSGMVFTKQSGDFMKPVIDVVDDMLLTDLKVVVYSGQLDLIVDTLGTERWVQKLKWPGIPQYNSANRKAITGHEGNVLAFVKQFKNFSFYWIMHAGHMVPADNGLAALEMVKLITK